jgi:Ca2+-binding EF-hand superfamily protein
MRGGAFLLCVSVLFWGMSGAAADEAAVPRHDPRAAFAEADTNHDGKIDREEFQERMVEIFFFGDRDKDGYMTWEELVPVVAFPEDFRDADRNGDGRYSFYEFVRVRFDDYDVVDTDQDGLLSLDEIVAVFERGGVR